MQLKRNDKQKKSDAEAAGPEADDSNGVVSADYEVLDVVPSDGAAKATTQYEQLQSAQRIQAVVYETLNPSTNN